MLAAGQQPLGSACRAPCICAPGCTASTRRQQSPRIDATTSAVQLHAFQRGRGGTQCKSVAAGHSMHSVDDSVTDGPSVLDTPAASAFPVKPMQTSQLRGGLLQTIHQSTIGRPPIGRRPSIASADSQPAVRVPRISRRHTLLASAAVALGAPLQAGPAQAAEEAVCARVARSAGRLSEAPGQPWSARLQGKEQVLRPCCHSFDPCCILRHLAPINAMKGVHNGMNGWVTGWSQKHQCVRRVRCNLCTTSLQPQIRKHGR